MPHHPPPQTSWEGYCNDYQKEHIFQDCPKNPLRVSSTTQINVIEDYQAILLDLESLKGKFMALEQENQHLVKDLQQVTIEKSVQPSPGSISSKQVSKVFLAQLEVNISSFHQVHVSALLDTEANSCFMDGDFASFTKYPCISFLDAQPCKVSTISLQ
ncbi:hypothetical protein KP509_37G021400 [Ceratopteris richardii]|uniref:Uncharacterized protein n=1 Tax=Ceratopteris richardii TaxID=49495 RepID=A0A8T2Q875_CERRI|nr:hypothetical protein KP509_37G021400 [Ceratopteris richardii]